MTCAARAQAPCLRRRIPLGVDGEAANPVSDLFVRHSPLAIDVRMVEATVR